jgi:hypothetical protein
MTAAGISDQDLNNAGVNTPYDLKITPKKGMRKLSDFTEGN